jgi:hypothetical protein
MYATQVHRFLHLSGNGKTTRKLWMARVLIASDIKPRRRGSLTILVQHLDGQTSGQRASLRRCQMYRLNQHKETRSGGIVELSPCNYGHPVAMHLHMKAKWGHGDDDPPTLSVGTRWKWVVEFMAWSFCHVGKNSWRLLRIRQYGLQGRSEHSDGQYT